MTGIDYAKVDDNSLISIPVDSEGRAITPDGHTTLTFQTVGGNWTVTPSQRHWSVIVDRVENEWCRFDDESLDDDDVDVHEYKQTMADQLMLLRDDYNKNLGVHGLRGLTYTGLLDEADSATLSITHEIQGSRIATMGTLRLVDAKGNATEQYVGVLKDGTWNYPTGKVKETDGYVLVRKDSNGGDGTCNVIKARRDAWDNAFHVENRVGKMIAGENGELTAYWDRMDIDPPESLVLRPVYYFDQTAGTETDVVDKYIVEAAADGSQTYTVDVFLDDAYVDVLARGRDYGEMRRYRVSRTQETDEEGTAYLSISAVCTRDIPCETVDFDTPYTPTEVLDS